MKKRLKDDEQRFVDTVAAMAAEGQPLFAAAVAGRAGVNPHRLRMFARRHNAPLIFFGEPQPAAVETATQPVAVAAPSKAVPPSWKPEQTKPPAPQPDVRPAQDEPKLAPPNPPKGTPVDGDVQGQ